MNISNKLTISRIFLTFVFMYFVFARWPGAEYFAFLTFLAAALTDYYDGYFARKEGSITDFGKLMDPIADKILVLSAFLAFVELKLIPAWTVLIIVAREATVTGLRIFALTKGKVIEAEEAGKHKTVSQMIAIFMILIFLMFREAGKALAFWNPDTEIWIKNLIFVVMLVTVGLTLTSGISFFLKNRKLLS
ncbi:MAG: CDP-diacylglycerol--glycerol-3-phosphate 3-phosphatidyltransferase [Candidatus Omnitrophica bacterium]|jgi:CDP-diacylglycerol--glycerol-3-phosphate 3-phosphatidyltransferase|nr:CDP-diacylglycerol--glycerol-3-phosphate 3-phosphatidyltransferase [Candidatus Omnitrophota bacterium]